MDLQKGVTATKELGELIKDIPTDLHDHVLRLLAVRTDYLRYMFLQVTPVEFVEAFYETFDAMVVDIVHGVSCKKGCHFCCALNVEISEPEAAIIAIYCQEHGIAMPKAYFKEQLKYNRSDVARSDVRWCAFLKDGACSIYPVRPLACRKYYVGTDPKFCDTMTYGPPTNYVGTAIFASVEMDTSAFYAVMSEKCKTGRLPEMLMKYAK